MTSAKEKVFSAGHLDAVNAAHPHMVRFLPQGFKVCDVRDTVHINRHTNYVSRLMHSLDVSVCAYMWRQSK